MMKITLEFTPFPALDTERLELRQLEYRHSAEFFTMRSNATLMKYIPRPMANVEADVLPLIDVIDKALAANERINWGVFEKASGRLVGTIGFVRILQDSHRGEVGYMLHQDYQGKGFMQEALQRVLRYGFETMGLHSIEAVIHPDNTASRRLVEANHFRQEAQFKDYMFHNGAYLDAVVYSLINPHH